MQNVRKWGCFDAVSWLILRADECFEVKDLPAGQERCFGGIKMPPGWRFFLFWVDFLSTYCEINNGSAETGILSVHENF